MKKRLHKAVLAAVLAASLPMSAFAGTLADYPDAPKDGHWAHDAMAYAVQHEFLKGMDGKLKAEGKLTRAQMAVILNRAFAAVETADISAFGDVKSSDWFAQDMAKALKMGSLTGRSATEMAPNAAITRQEVMAFLARLLALPNGQLGDLSRFGDAAQVSDWAVGGVAALVNSGIVGGSANNALYPQATITRAEFAAMMQKAFPNVITNADQLNALKDGNVLIVAPIDVIKDIHIKGDMILADGIGGKISKFDHCTIDGRLIVRGGDLQLANSKIGKGIVVNDPNRTTVIDADEVDGLGAKTPVELKKGKYKNVSGSDVKVNKPDAEIVDKIDKKPDNNTTSDKKPTSNKDDYVWRPGGSSHHHDSDSKENKTLEGDANVDQWQYPSAEPFIHSPFYNAYVKVVVDKNGKVVSVTDNGTREKSLLQSTKPGSEPKKSWVHDRWWNLIEKADFYKKFEGKTRDEIASLNVGAGEADTVTGATESAKAVRQAVLNALDGKPGKKFLTREQTLIAEPVKVDSGTATVHFKNTLPAEFKVKLHSVYHTVYNAEEKNLIPADQYTWTPAGDGFDLKLKNADLKAGKYFVNIVDESGMYRSPDFENTHNNPAHHPYFELNKGATIKYDEGTKKLIATDNDIPNVIDNVKKITLTEIDENGKPVPVEKDEHGNDKIKIEPVTHRGIKGAYAAAPFFKEDGSVNPDAKKGSYVDSGVAAFEAGKIYKVQVETFGYGTVEFVYKADKKTDQPTGKELLGDANVDQQYYPSVYPFIHPPFYNAYVKVVVDGSGKVVSVSDNDTKAKSLAQSTKPGATPPKTWKHDEYWALIEGSNIFKKFEGKNRDEIAALKMETGGADTVSGATESAKAVRQAVLNALDGKPGKKFLTPEQTLTAEPIKVQSGTATVHFKNTLPADFKVKLHSVYHTVYNAEEKNLIPADQYTWAPAGDGFDLTLKNVDLKAGKYFVNIVDESGMYRSPDFESGHGTPEHHPYFELNKGATIAYDESAKKLTATDNDIPNVIDNIKEIVVTEIDENGNVVKIKDKDGKEKDNIQEIEPIGHHGIKGGYSAGPFFNQDGTINPDAKTGKVSKPVSVLAPGKIYKVQVETFGYGTTEFVYKTDKKTDQPTNKELLGDANVDQQQYPSVYPFIHPPFYNAYVKVVVDGAGKVVSVSDNETRAKSLERSTKPGEAAPTKWKHDKYWSLINQEFYKKFEGKSRDEIAALKMGTDEADTVSGATESAKAIRQAVLNALDGKAGKKFLTPEQTLKTAAPIEKGTTTVAFANTLPADFKVKLHSVSYGIYNGENAVSGCTLSDDGTTLTVPGDLKPGHYYVNIVDESGTYRSPDFESGHGTERHYPLFVVKNTATLSYADEKIKVSDNNLADVLLNIEEIVVTEVDADGNPVKVKNKEGKEMDKVTEIEPVGHHGTVNQQYKEKPFIKSDGSLDKDYKSRYGKIIEDGKNYKVEVHVWGFEEPLKFDIKGNGTPTPKPEEKEKVIDVTDPSAKTPENYVRLTFDAKEGKFGDKDGQPITQKYLDVKKGITGKELKESGKLPTNPTAEGKNFKAWDAALPGDSDQINEAKTYHATYENDQPAPQPDNGKELTGSAPHEDFDYMANIKFILKDGKVYSLADNGTQPRSSKDKKCWNKALKGMTAKFENGVSKDAIDSVDTISGATVSSNAIKEAIKNGLKNS